MKQFYRLTALLFWRSCSFAAARQETAMGNLNGKRDRMIT